LFFVEFASFLLLVGDFSTRLHVSVSRIAQQNRTVTTNN